MTKMVFFDIDGTLLDHGTRKIPASTIYAIEELKKREIPVAIATGRAPFLFKEIREQTGISNFISFNGSYAVYEEEVIHATPLEKQELIKLTEKAEQLGFPLVYLDHEGMRSNVLDHPRITKSFDDMSFEYPKLDKEYAFNRDIYQALIFANKEEEHHYVDKYDNFDFVRWHVMSTDILPKGGSKANGIKAMTEKMGIPLSDVVAFGDALNDLEMLTTVGHGVAMGNGLDEVKKNARYITKPIDEDGILHGLQMLGML